MMTKGKENKNKAELGVTSSDIINIANFAAEVKISTCNH